MTAPDRPGGCGWIGEAHPECGGHKPPAAAQQEWVHDGHQPWCAADCTAMHYPPIPAEAQQDDGPSDEAMVRAAEQFMADQVATWEVTFAAGPGQVVSLSDAAHAAARWHRAVAARPSADTETLREPISTEELIERTAGDEFWHWETCCCCGDGDVSHRGLVLTETSGKVVRVGWCSSPSCQADRKLTGHFPVGATR